MDTRKRSCHANFCTRFPESISVPSQAFSDNRAASRENMSAGIQQGKNKHVQLKMMAIGFVIKEIKRMKIKEN